MSRLLASYAYASGVPWLLVLIGLAAAATIVLALVLALRRASRSQAIAERKLQVQDLYHQALLDNIPYPVFVKDAEGRYLVANRAYERVFCCQRSAVLGHTLVETQHVRGANAEVLHAADLRLLSSAGHEHRELVLATDEEETRDVLLWLQSFSPGEGQLARLLGTAVDVTELREAEARALASEKRLTDITRTMPSAVFQIRVWPDGRREFTYAAGDTIGTFGLSPEQLMADESLAFSRIHHEDRDLTARMVARAASEMRAMPAFDVRVQIEGEVRWIQTQGGQPKLADGGAVEWSGYWIDTTQAHAQAEALSEAKAQAEAAVAAKRTFLAMMSHEIRTPMAAALGLIELLAKNPKDAEQAHMLAMLEDSAGALLQVVDDILDFSKIRSRKLELEIEPFDLRVLVDSVVGLMIPRAREKGLALHSVLDWRLASQFAGDATRVRQVVTNLLSNALKFTQQGQVVLSVELVEERSGEEQALRICVADTGVGISSDNLARLFQPFTQAETSTTRRFGGTGLGLTISQYLAEMMGGSVHLDSVVGVGTRAVFEVSLPILRRLDPVPEFLGKSALLCARDANVLRALSNALSALGFNLIESDAVDLIDFASDDISLLLLDQDIANLLKTPDVPRILLSVGPEAHGIQIRDGSVVLGANPLLWRSVIGACQRVLGCTAQTDEVKLPPVFKREGRILVAEDHPINRALISRQLDQIGYAHDVVEDGEQALAALQKCRYDVLITDCYMPKMDGYELTRRLRHLENGAAHMPVIALSASSLAEEVQRCHEAGMDDFLAKPTRLQDLDERLHAHLTNAATSERMKLYTEKRISSQELGALEEAFGSRAKVRDILCDVLCSCRHDLSSLDEAINGGDTRLQEHILHRCESVLQLAMPRPDYAPVGVDQESRRRAIEQWMSDIQESIHLFGRAPASPAGH